MSGKVEAGVFNAVETTLQDYILDEKQRKFAAEEISKKIYFYLKENIRTLVRLNPSAIKQALDRNAMRSLRQDTKIAVLFNIDKTAKDIADNVLIFNEGK